jgi:hypothetical protein
MTPTGSAAVPHTDNTAGQIPHPPDTMVSKYTAFDTSPFFNITCLDTVYGLNETVKVQDFVNNFMSKYRFEAAVSAFAYSQLVVVGSYMSSIPDPTNKRSALLFSIWTLTYVAQLIATISMIVILAVSVTKVNSQYKLCAVPFAGSTTLAWTAFFSAPMHPAVLAIMTSLYAGAVVLHTGTTLEFNKHPAAGFVLQGVFFFYAGTIGVFVLWYCISVFVGLVLALGPFFAAIIGALVLKKCCSGAHGWTKKSAFIFQVLLFLLSLVGFSFPFIGFLVISSLACAIASAFLSLFPKCCADENSSANAAWSGDGAKLTAFTLAQFGSCQLLVFGVISALAAYSSHGGDTSSAELGRIFESASAFTEKSYSYVFAVFKPPYPDPAFAMLPMMFDIAAAIQALEVVDWFGDPYELLEATNAICSLNLFVSIIRGTTSTCAIMLNVISCCKVGKPLNVGKQVIEDSPERANGRRDSVKNLLWSGAKQAAVTLSVGAEQATV